jgi:hypothetical protein
MNREQAEIAASWSEWCDKAERGGLKCKPCAAKCCHLKGGEQRQYKGFNVLDTILLCGDKNGGITIETDLEVPFDVDPRKAGDVRTLMARKKAIITLELGRKIKKLQDEGITITDPFYHQHYNPKRLPEIGALHVHVRANAPNIPEAKKLAERLWGVIDAPRLTKLVE